LESYFYADRRKDHLNSPLLHFFANADQLTPSNWFVMGSDSLVEYGMPEHEFSTWESHLAGDALHVAYCEADVQSYYTGSSLNAKLNLPRLSIIFPDFDLRFLNREIHPLP
jgi:hypothetical protein